MAMALACSTRSRKRGGRGHKKKVPETKRFSEARLGQARAVYRHSRDLALAVRIQPGGALIFARLRAAMDGFGGAFIEAYALDAKLARKVPRKMIRAR